MEESMKQKWKIRNIISITVSNLIQVQNLGLSDYLSIDYPNTKEFRLFILHYTKKKQKKIRILLTFFFTG